MGKAKASPWCSSLIYYLADLQTLILSTLEEEKPPTHPPSPGAHVTLGLAWVSLLWTAASFAGPLDARPSCVTGLLFLEHVVEYTSQSPHPSHPSAVCGGPLDTVWHFQVPSFLCLGCQPLNGLINVSPKGNFHSQLPKESLSCDAFLLDINRPREGQVMEGKQAESMHQPATGSRQQASKKREKGPDCCFPFSRDALLPPPPFWPLLSSHTLFPPVPKCYLMC